MKEVLMPIENLLLLKGNQWNREKVLKQQGNIAFQSTKNHKPAECHARREGAQQPEFAEFEQSNCSAEQQRSKS